MSDEYLLIHFEDGEQLGAWLEENGETHDEVWVEIYKKHTGVKSIAWAEIVDTVLCFGWIDSQSRRIDEDRYRQRLTAGRRCPGASASAPRSYRCAPGRRCCSWGRFCW